MHLAVGAAENPATRVDETVGIEAMSAPSSIAVLVMR